MDRVLQNTPATINMTWYEDGDIADPGTVTIGIVRADGTELAVDGTATAGTGEAARTYTLTDTDNALLDTLTATWVSTTHGTMRAVIEVVGGFLFSVSDIRQFEPLSDETTYTSAKIAAARTMAEQVIEDATGVAFVPRYRYRTVSPVRDTTLRLWDPYITSIRSGSIYGTALTEPQLDAVTVDGEFITHTANWYPGPVTVGYEYGRPFPPAHISRAAMLLAKFYLVDSPIDDRYTSVSTDVGTFSLVTPGVRGAWTSIPEVNQAIEMERVMVIA